MWGGGGVGGGTVLILLRSGSQCRMSSFKMSHVYDK